MSTGRLEEVTSEIVRRIKMLSDDPTTAARECRAMRSYLAAQDDVPDEWKRGIGHMIDQASELYDDAAIMRAGREQWHR